MRACIDIVAHECHPQLGQGMHAAVIVTHLLQAGSLSCLRIELRHSCGTQLRCPLLILDLLLHQLCQRCLACTQLLLQGTDLRCVCCLRCCCSSLGLLQLRGELGCCTLMLQGCAGCLRCCKGCSCLLELLLQLRCCLAVLLPSLRQLLLQGTGSSFCSRLCCRCCFLALLQLLSELCGCLRVLCHADVKLPLKGLSLRLSSSLCSSRCSLAVLQLASKLPGCLLVLLLTLCQLLLQSADMFLSSSLRCSCGCPLLCQLLAQVCSCIKPNVPLSRQICRCLLCSADLELQLPQLAVQLLCSDCLAALIMLCTRQTGLCLAQAV